MLKPHLHAGRLTGRKRELRHGEREEKVRGK